MKKIFLLTAVFFLFLLPQESYAQVSAEASRLLKNARIQVYNKKLEPFDFTLQLLHGEGVSLSSFKSKVVILNFWATWCPPCRAEMPSMEVLHNKYREKGLEILAVNILEKEAEVLSFMDSNKLSFPAALDLDGAVSNSYGIQSIPTTFLIDREGNIVVRLVGSIDWDTPKIHNAIEKLLNSTE